MVQRCQLADYLANLLEIHRYSDYCPNGLQVAGSAEINTLVSGVTACQSLLTAALSHQADAILVHHGYFWKNESPCITGLKQKRLAMLLQNDVSLYAYHLPLDCHPRYGNNIQLAGVLDLQVTDTLAVQAIENMLYVGCLAQHTAANDFAQHITRCLHRVPLHIEAPDRPLVNRVAWCSGAAQGFIEQAISCDVDAYLSGEISEQTVHIAREANVHFYAAGHHATERYGVQALGNHLAERFGIRHIYVDIDNPV